MSTETMTALDFYKTHDYPVLRFASTGLPAGVDLALLDETEVGFEWHDLVGTVRESGTWEWDGEGFGEHTDSRGNTVTAVWLRDDREEYERQEREYNEAF